MVYYEKEGKVPPVAITAKLAAFFAVTVEDLVASADAPAQRKTATAPDLLNDADDRRLWRQFRQLKRLSAHDQATVLRMLNSLAQHRTPERPSRHHGQPART